MYILYCKAFTVSVTLIYFRIYNLILYIRIKKGVVKYFVTELNQFVMHIVAIYVPCHKVTATYHHRYEML